jgi:hypothetical protein
MQICGYFPTFRDNISVLSSRGKHWAALPLKMGPIGCPETSSIDYQYTLRKEPEERKFNLHCYESLKSLQLRSVQCTEADIQGLSKDTCSTFSHLGCYLVILHVVCGFGTIQSGRRLIKLRVNVSSVFTVYFHNEDGDSVPLPNAPSVSGRQASKPQFLWKPGISQV